MGNFGYVFGYALFFSFCMGAVVAMVATKARRWMALRRKPAATAKYIRLLEQIIADWDGTEEELDALIVLENTILYHV